jgi:hypothetical protein
MTTQTQKGARKMDLKNFETIWEEIYSDLQNFTGENAPSTYTWWAGTKKELEEECDRLVGNPDDIFGLGKPVVHLYHCEAAEYTIICEKITADQVRSILNRHFGMDGKEAQK